MPGFLNSLFGSTWGQDDPNTLDPAREVAKPSPGGISPFQQSQPSGQNDFLSALGFSLLSSPRGAPLANFGQAYGGLQERSQKRAEQAKQTAGAESMARVLEAQGMTTEAEAVRSGSISAGQGLNLLAEARDPMKKLEIEKAGLEISNLRRPTYKYFADGAGSMYRVDENDPAGQAQLIHDSPAKAPNDPAEVQEYKFYANGELKANKAPLSYNDWRLQGKKAGASNVNVGSGEGQYDKTVGEGYGKRFLTMQDDAQTAQKTMNGLRVMQGAMADPNFYSGTGADSIASLKRLSASIGINPEGVSSIETFNALAKQATLDNMGGSLGTGFSNADRDFVTGQVPSLDNSPQGNSALIDIQSKIAQRKVQVAHLARDYAGQHNGRIDTGFDDYLAKWSEANPLFADQQASSPSGTPAPPRAVDMLRSNPSLATQFDRKYGQGASKQYLGGQ